MTDQGRHAIGRALADILAKRYPGTTWLPVDAAKLDAQPRPGEVVWRFAPPEDPHPPAIQEGDTPGERRAA